MPHGEESTANSNRADDGKTTPIAKTSTAGQRLHPNVYSARHALERTPTPRKPEPGEDPGPPGEAFHAMSRRFGWDTIREGSLEREGGLENNAKWAFMACGLVAVFTVRRIRLSNLVASCTRNVADDPTCVEIISQIGGGALRVCNLGEILEGFKVRSRISRGIV